MSSRTAEGVYMTLLKGLQFLVDYFRHIRHPELLHIILMKMLNDSLVEAFFCTFDRNDSWQQFNIHVDGDACCQ